MAGTDPLAGIARPWAIPDGTLVLSADAPRSEWLAARRLYIGGSDVAKMLGLSKWGSTYSVWADKTGEAPDEPATTAQRRGQIFEDAIVKLWTEQYATFPIRTRRQGLVRSRLYPHVGATVDRLSICAFDGQPHRCIIEVKSQISMDEWADDEVPVDHQVQGQHQLLATGREHVHYVGMGPRFVPEHRIIHRDDELMLLLGERVEAFWELNVVGGVAPPAVGKDSDAVRARFRQVTPGKVCTVDAELEPHVRALRDARQDHADAAGRIADATAALQAAMGDAEVLQYPDGEVVATWKAGKTIDGANAAWRKAHPEVVDRYGVPTVELDVKKAVENEPELVGAGGLRYRRTFTVAGA